MLKVYGEHEEKVLPMAEFVPFPKMPRLNREMQITEKVDGTNACIVIVPEDEFDTSVFAQSRKRLITPDEDNAGFARWVHDNRGELEDLLGPGRHFGEWYGSSIQGNPYNLDHKRFALFDPLRYRCWEGTHVMVGEAMVHAVPLLYIGPFNSTVVNMYAQNLKSAGSQLPDCEGRPAEGVVVWHEAARQSFKVTCHADEKPKGSYELG